MNPLVIHDIAKGFPDISFIIPHFGCGYTRNYCNWRGHVRMCM